MFLELLLDLSDFIKYVTCLDENISACLISHGLGSTKLVCHEFRHPNFIDNFAVDRFAKFNAFSLHY